MQATLYWNTTTLVNLKSKFKYLIIDQPKRIPLGILFFCQIRHGNIILITSITYETMKEVHV